MNATYKGPGPWTVRTEQAFGFEVSRAMGGYQSEYLPESPFDTQAAAQAAADTANKGERA